MPADVPGRAIEQPLPSGPDPRLTAPPPPPATEIEVRLRILATTDLHGQILSYDYFANRRLFGQGLAQTASLIAAARAEVPGAILLDNGDFLQGSALAEIAQTRGRRRPHPAIAAFNALDYDAVGLGNHEFNYGVEFLQEALNGARFPVLSANVALRLGATPCEDLLFAPAHALIDRELPDGAGGRHRVRVGVIGLTPPQILDWDNRHLKGRLFVRPMREAAAAWVPALRRAGADLVVCLAHTGVNPTSPLNQEFGAAGIVGLEGVDAVIAGHNHQVFPGPRPPADPRFDPETGLFDGKPLVEPGHSGSYLGVIEFRLQRGAAGGWQIASAQAAAVSASEVVAGLSAARIRKAAAPLVAAVGPDHRAALAWMRRGLGRSTMPIDTFFATAADSQALRLVAAAKAAHVARMLAGRPEGALPVLATATPYRAGGRGGPLNFTAIPAGPLSVRNVHDLYSFPNTIVAEVVTGAVLLRWLERSASIFAQQRPGQESGLIDPTVPGHWFQMIPALGYRIDLSRPAGQGRIRDLTHHGRPVAPEDRFVLATNSFLAGALPPEGRELVLDDGVPCTEVLVDHIRKLGGIGPLPGPGWSFVPMPGAAPCYDTGAGALAALDQVAHLRPEFLGLTPEGFHRFRLHL